MSLDTIRALCAQFAAGDALRDAGLTTPAEIERFNDLRYSEHSVWGLLDVYRRKDAPAFQPVLVNVHGGGYVYGTKETYQFYGMGMALRGFTVVNFNYRLAPEHPYPCALEDVNAVMHWVCAHDKEYGFDLNNVFMVGDSAGAALLSEYATLWASKEYRSLFGWEVPRFRLGAVGLNCGFYCITDDFRPDGEAVASYYGDDPLTDHGDRLRLHKFIDACYPPSYVMTCEDDFLRDRAEPMAALLRERGVEAEYAFYTGTTKPLGHVFHVDQKSDDAKRCNDAEAAFLKQYMI